MSDPAKILAGVLGEADALIRRLLKERGIEFPHLVVAVTPDGEVVLRSNVSPDALWCFGEDLIKVADEINRRQSRATPRTDYSMGKLLRLLFAFDFALKVPLNMKNHVRQHAVGVAFERIAYVASCNAVTCGDAIHDFHDGRLGAGNVLLKRR